MLSFFRFGPDWGERLKISIVVIAGIISGMAAAHGDPSSAKPCPDVGVQAPVQLAEKLSPLDQLAKLACSDSGAPEKVRLDHCRKGPDCIPVNPNSKNTGESKLDPHCKPGMVYIAAKTPTDPPAFCIDQYEASLVLEINGEPWSPYHPPKRELPARAVSSAGAVPQGYISQEAAAMACSRAGKALCTDAQWLRACKGPGNKNLYPYGGSKKEDKVLGRCNDHYDPTGQKGQTIFSHHPAQDVLALSPEKVASGLGKELLSSCINQFSGGLLRTGERKDCATEEKVYDMMGNLHEWTAERAFRGGYYVDTVRHHEGCNYVTTAHASWYFDYSTGFRCCAAAQN